MFARDSWAYHHSIQVWIIGLDPPLDEEIAQVDGGRNDDNEDNEWVVGDQDALVHI